MSEVGERMLGELVRIREALERGETLGFGKRVAPTYLFVHHPKSVQEADHLWYWRDKGQRVNHPIYESDLTGFIKSVYRRDRGDAGGDAGGDTVALLNVLVYAGRPYVLQTGFWTNFSISLLAALNELGPGDLDEPVTLVAELSPGRRGRPTVFCRLERRGGRLLPTWSKKDDVGELYDAVVAKFGFANPLTGEDRDE